jgi:hypothetical protein
MTKPNLEPRGPVAQAKVNHTARIFPGVYKTLLACEEFLFLWAIGATESRFNWTREESTVVEQNQNWERSDQPRIHLKS